MLLPFTRPAVDHGLLRQGNSDGGLWLHQEDREALVGHLQGLVLGLDMNQNKYNSGMQETGDDEYHGSSAAVFAVGHIVG